MARIIFALVLSFVVSASACAEESSPARILMEKSGMIEQFGDFDQQMHDQILEGAKGNSLISDDAAFALADIARRAMNPERILADLEKVLADTLSPEQMTDFTAFYDTDLGKTVLAMEIAASSPEAQTERKKQSASILADLKSRPQEMALFRQVDEILHTTELSVTAVLTFMHTIAIAVAESQERGGPEIHEKMLEQISGLRAMIRQSVHEEILVNYAYTYRDLSNEDLVAYMGFLQTRTAAATYAAMSAGMQEIFQSRGYEIGSGFAEYLKQKKI